MADYKELLRRAVEALPENNGAARRAVYEKARAALVGQLRAINPPLPARDITTHRLQLEDCIRQVEQEASEAVIAGMGNHAEPPPPPVYFEPNGAGRAQPQLAKPQSATPKPNGAAARPTGGKPALVAKEPPRGLPVGDTIEDIIKAANADPAPARKPAPKGASMKPAPRHAPIRIAAPTPEPPEEEMEPEEDQGDDILPPRPAARPNSRPLPSIVARAEAARNRSHAAPFGVPAGDKPYDAPRRGPSIEPRREAPRLEPAARGAQQTAVARQQVVEPVAFLEQPKVFAAMSAVREVDVEPQPSDPQGAIDRAIATLDREARGETDSTVNGVTHDIEEENEAPNGKARGFAGMLQRGRKPAATPAPRQERAMGRQNRREPLMPKPVHRARESGFAEPGFPRARAEREGGMSAITIFLIVFAVLLAGAGGAGYWAVSQGYLDLSTMFRPTAVADAATTPAAAVTADAGDPATGPGNTATPAETATPATELAGEDRLVPEAALTGSEPALALAAPSDTAAGEERLTGTDTAVDAGAAVAALDPVNMAGSQSLLLEASEDGTTGAVPFSGTVDWSKGTDETGLPTLVGKANIPARNLGVDVLIRKNSDPSLPASHLMEVNFRVTDTFIGGSVAGLPGVLLKNEELVQGTPLVGASARVVGNSFLFALSASPEDLSTNTSLLTGRKWLDLALIYATGKRAIITLEKDDAAEQLFGEVFASWGQTASAQ